MNLRALWKTALLHVNQPFNISVCPSETQPKDEIRAHSKLGVQLVGVVNDVAQLLSGERPAGRQQVLPGRCLPGGYHGDVKGLHSTESRHVQHQGDIRATSAEEGWEGRDKDSFC